MSLVILKVEYGDNSGDDGDTASSLQSANQEDVALAVCLEAFLAFDGVGLFVGLKEDESP